MGGLRQLQQVNRELGRMHFPHDFPDTPSGQQWLEESKKADSETYYKRPPAKRANYQKLGTLSHAFAVNWKELVKGKGDVDCLHVLRSRRCLKAIHKALQTGDVGALPTDSMCVDRALIPVCVKPVLKGVPSAKAAIYLPSQDDLQNLKADSKFPGPSEPIHTSKDMKSNDPCSRTVLGYISAGDMSLSVGRGEGLGFVSFAGLKQLLESQHGKGIKVLVRGITETVYRFHVIEIIC